MNFFIALCEMYAQVLDWFWSDDCFKIYSY